MDVVKKKINHRSVFKPRTKNDDNTELTKDLILSVRKTGQLNLSSKGLSSVPERVWTINELTQEEIQKLDMGLDTVEKKECWWEYEPLKVLNLNFNSLTELSQSIEILSELNVLNLRDNLIETLPPEIGNIGKLRKLDLAFNKLKALPLNFYNLSELRTLDMSNNILEELDAAVGDLIMLEYMNVSHNNLTTLPIGMGYLVRLVCLDLSHNKLKDLPPDIMSMRALQKLDTSHNCLETLPPFGELRKLEVLMLHVNNLKTFPNTIGCVALRELHLANNIITDIDTSCLESMGQLKMLTLGNNKIEIIPDEIVQLLNLQRLDLSFNNISKIPASISTMPNLQHFVIDGNDIKNVRRDIIQCGTSRIFQHLRQSTEIEIIKTTKHSTPNIGNNTFPDKYTMANTKLLSLVGQNLDEVPKFILEDARAVEVTCVDLSKNKLSELHDTFAVLSMATELTLRFNLLTTLPNWIGDKYKHLRFIDLSNNRLSTLPVTINLLERLREINISYNKYTELPNCIYDVIGLETLIASNNQISTIDVPALNKLRMLATLDLSNNNIKYVPPELGNLKNLRTLELSGNFFKQPRQATLTKGTEEILAYLRNRIPS